MEPDTITGAGQEHLESIVTKPCLVDLVNR
jgi:hypothetical protein